MDGQQRLATVTILLGMLRDLSHEIGTPDGEIFAADIQGHLIFKEDVGFALVLGELDKEYFIKAVQSDPPAAVDPELRSHRNIKRAREVLRAALEQAVSGMNSVSALAEFKALRKIVRNELVMASIPVESERDAFKIFETLNDRGLCLSTPDLLLNHLMGSASNEGDRSTIRELWNDMLESMGRRDINRFIRHMWVSKYGDLKNIDLFSALKKRIEADNKTSVEFAQACAEECARYVELLKIDTEALGDATRYVRTLVADLGLESTLPLLLAAHSTLKPVELAKVARWLLVFVAKYSIVAQRDAGGMETILFALARDLRTKIAQGSKPNDCVDLVKDRLVKNAPVESVVLSSIPNLILEPEEATYILSRVATHIQSKTKELALGESNLEHIFPKKPSSDWSDQEKKKLEPLLWALGNLTMLGTRLNDKAASKGYTKKRDDYKKSELVISQTLAADYASWGENQIRSRATKLGKKIMEIWNFDNPSRV